MQTSKLIRAVFMLILTIVLFTITKLIPNTDIGSLIAIISIVELMLTIHYFLDYFWETTFDCKAISPSQSQPSIKLELFDEAKKPFYAHETDAGMDIYANEDITIAPGETKLIHTGLKMAIPEGYEIQVRPRSGLSLKTPLRICNTPGTIDAGYRDEIGIIMQNTSERFYTDGAGEIHVMPDCEKNHYTIDSKDNRKGWYDIKKGDRVAQIVLAKVPHIEFKEVKSIAEVQGDRGGGFGSTGTK